MLFSYQVGDCVGSSADIFESIAAEIIGAMILAGALAGEADVASPVMSIQCLRLSPFIGVLMQTAYIYFPVLVHAFDIVVSSLGVLSLGSGDPGARAMPPEPLTALKRGTNLS
jgi:inorganic pyrophosphatase